MGTPRAAVPSLRALAETNHVVAVYTRQDKPKGRGRRVSASAVKETATELGLEVIQPKTLRGGGEATRLRELQLDAVAVVAYGMILPPDVLAAPRLGCVNVHFSLLPRWRGAAPVERAILAGDDRTGVTTMLMDEGLDTGPIILQEPVAIGPHDTTGTLLERLSGLGADLLPRTLSGLDAGNIAPRSQPSDRVTLAPKVEPREAELDFTEPAAALERRVRALDPSPGAHTFIGGRRVKVWRADVASGDGAPATVAAVGTNGIEVATASGRLRLEVVQPEGRRQMSAAEFVRGHPVAVGERVGL